MSLAGITNMIAENEARQMAMLASGQAAMNAYQKKIHEQMLGHVLYTGTADGLADLMEAQQSFGLFNPPTQPQPVTPKDHLSYLMSPPRTEIVPSVDDLLKGMNKNRSVREPKWKWSKELPEPWASRFIKLYFGMLASSPFLLLLHLVM